MTASFGWGAAHPLSRGARGGGLSEGNHASAPGTSPRGRVAARSVAGEPVAVAVEVVDVGPDHLNRSRRVGRTIPAAAGAVDVGGDGHAASGVVRIAAAAVRSGLGFRR